VALSFKFVGAAIAHATSVKHIVCILRITMAAVPFVSM
jgi:hypothetical protein